ncbi:MAG: hypothetical protein HYY59_01045 [Candidatus Omnitrophica bacterium]|nr:hypothetical protein [Candidatus Omnitrophota bacterium]MBI2495320.1 hypothetical protein [Candidatus Omnitrophota bacterium]MBI3020575.1 hypothetical protein [Candidatus Omnitrophota bacterium]
MKDGTAFLGRSATVFAVLAWVSLVIQVFVGLAVLIMGGPPVPIGGAEIPARLIGVLNFVAAAIYWFLFTFLSKTTRLLLDIHAQVAKADS